VAGLGLTRRKGEAPTTWKGEDRLLGVTKLPVAALETGEKVDIKLGGMTGKGVGRGGFRKIHLSLRSSSARPAFGLGDPNLFYLL